MVCSDCESHILRINSGQHVLLHSVLKHGARVEEHAVLLSKIGFRVLSHLGEVELGVHTLSSTRTTDGALCGFHSDLGHTKLSCQ